MRSRRKPGELRFLAPEALDVAHLQDAAVGQHRARLKRRLEHRARPRLLSRERSSDGERGHQVGSRRLARQRHARLVDVPGTRVSRQPGVGRAHVLDGGGEAIARRQSIVDVDHLVAEARERQRHHPVRVLGQDAKAAAVHVQHRRKRTGPVGRPVDVQAVLGAPVVEIGKVANHLDRVSIGPRVRVQPPGRGDAAKEIVDEQRAGLATKAVQHGTRV